MNDRLIKKLKLLKQSKHRKIKNQFVAEGKRLVGEAINYGSTVDSLFCTQNFYNKNVSSWQGFLRVENSMIKVITDSQFKSISSTSTPSGIAALCNIPRSPYIDFKVREWIYLDKIRDPGNLGTILRSALWFGFKNILLSSKSVDPYNPKTIRSGMGSHFGLNLYQNVRLNDFIKTHLIVSGSTYGEDISVFKLPEKYVLVLGNEAHGISKNIEPLIQKSVSIKRLGEGESLNLSSAASILMYSFTRKK
ncbi:MAG: rRNA methyltransferase [Candidatus Neomarinimicrobiota bacterium]|nr:MAG: rRNA methyltransferase [Candidatus Neomarinimicrobiota bacterium]